MIKQSEEECILDTSCTASLTECVDFASCINTNNALTVTNTVNNSLTVECADPNAIPANNGGTDGVITCVCDGKNDCVWQSDDFVGDITEDGMCITDHTCPKTMFEEYEGELQFTRNRFIQDATHNTLQDDLYDSSKAEVLGRIETSAIANFDTNWDWAKGHFLVIIWPDVLKDHLTICPYGDYYDAYESSLGDGDVQVFETFVNPLVLRDGSNRDVTTQNIEVVLNIRHDYDLDVEDISELLIFRIAMVPKTWQDEYGDWITKTAEEISECLNAMLNEKAKVDGSLRSNKRKVTSSSSAAEKPKKKGNKWNKNKKNKGSGKWANRPKLSPEAWKKKQEARRKRLMSQ